jgi:hypothetical protein
MLAALGFIGIFLIFVVILYVGYVPDRSQTIDGAYRAARKAGIDEVRSRQRELVSTYGWVDRENGIVRIPVDRAMDLVVTEHNAGADYGVDSRPESIIGRLEPTGGEE